MAIGYGISKLTGRKCTFDDGVTDAAKGGAFGHIREVQGFARSEPVTHGGVTISPGEVTSRVLEVGIAPGSIGAGQLQALERAVQTVSNAS